MLLAVALVLIPFELGSMLYQGKQSAGELSLRRIVLYRQRMPWWQYIVLATSLFLWSVYVMMVVSPAVDKLFIRNLSSWQRDWFFIADFEGELQYYSRSILLLMAALNLLLNGLAVPIVEELYFRGYLLPRMAGLGRWAPLVSSLLFPYPFLAPWQNLGRLLAFVPLYNTVWWKRNLHLGMIVHCAANLAGAVMMLALILVSV